MILDIVKEGIPANVNTYTFYPYITMLNTGISVRYASMFIRQPILNTLAENYLDNQGINNSETGREIEEIKREYQTSLFKVLYKTNHNGFNTKNKNNDAYKKAVDSIKQGKNIWLKAEDADMLGYDATGDSDYAFSIEELKSNFKDFTFISGNKEKSDEVRKSQIEFLISQLKVLEQYKKYRKAGEGYQDIMRAMNADKIGAGPSLAKTEGMNRSIYKAAFYPKFNEVSYIDNFMKQALSTGQEVDYNDFGEGARIFSKVDGKYIPAVAAVYPSMFNKYHKSVYSVLETYKKYSNDFSYEIFSKEFIRYTPAFKQITNNLIHSLGKGYSEKIDDVVSKYLTSFLMNSHPMLRNVNPDTLLGTDNNFYTNDADWKKMSTANKVWFIKNKYKEVLENDNHILNYLKPKTTNDDYQRNGFQQLEFVNTKTDHLTDDRLTGSFTELWNGSINGNDDSMLSELAKELVQYNYYTAGFNMQKNSFSKLIPSSIFINEGFKEHFDNILLNLQDNEYITKLAPNIVEQIIKNNWDNRNIVPRAYTKRKQTSKGNVVVGVNWKPDYNGIIKTTSEKLKKSSKDLKNASYILVPIYKQVTDSNGKKRYEVEKEVLYKKFIKTKDEIAFYPVSRLGGRFFNEFTDKSVLEQNHVPQSEDTYTSAIELGRDFNNTNIAGLSYERLNIKGRKRLKDLYKNATRYIGDGYKGSRTNRLKTSFGTYADAQYTADDLVLVFGDEKGNKANIVKNLFDGPNLQGVYKNIYKALRAGSTIAIANDTPGISEQYIMKHLDKYVNKKNAADKREVNGIVYYSKKGYEANTIEDNLNVLNDEESFIVDENCK
jgi:hypothetical protein